MLDAALLLALWLYCSHWHPEHFSEPPAWRDVCDVPELDNPREQQQPRCRDREI